MISKQLFRRALQERGMVAAKACQSRTSNPLAASRFVSWQQTSQILPSQWESLRFQSNKKERKPLSDNIDEKKLTEEEHRNLEKSGEAEKQNKHENEASEETDGQNGFWGSLDMKARKLQSESSPQDLTDLTQKQRKKKLKLDQSLYTKEVPICAPDMGGLSHRLEAIHFAEGDILVWNDQVCDLSTFDGRFAYALGQDDEHPCFMGKIYIKVGDEIEDGEVVCNLLYRPDQYNPPSDGDEDDEDETWFKGFGSQQEGGWFNPLEQFFKEGKPENSEKEK